MSWFLTASIGGDDSQETVDNFPKIPIQLSFSIYLQRPPVVAVTFLISYFLLSKLSFSYLSSLA